MFNIGPTELILILVIALVIFGPGKLPEVGQTLGKTIREFKSAVNNMDADIKKEVNDVKSDMEEIKNTVNIQNTIEDIKKDIKQELQEDTSSANSKEIK